MTIYAKIGYTLLGLFLVLNWGMLMSATLERLLLEWLADMVFHSINHGLI